MILPQRKSLPHHIPLWINSNDATYFITICVQRSSPTGTADLTLGSSSAILLTSVDNYFRANRWFPLVFLLMPDHIHTILSFPGDIKSTITNWKRWTAKTAGINWQRDFFEHRIRDRNLLIQKFEYIRENPVRRKLATSADKWVHAWYPPN